MQSTIVIGLLLSGLLALGVIYMYQNHDKIGPGSVPVGRWNAQQVLIEFNQFMAVLEQHERVVSLLPPGLDVYKKAGDHVANRGGIEKTINDFDR
ncbi:MAG: hypothetical protein ACJ0US_02220 [Arenicellales bacterium]